VGVVGVEEGAGATAAGRRGEAVEQWVRAALQAAPAASRHL